MRQTTFDEYLGISGDPEPEQLSIEEILRGPTKNLPRFATSHYRCFIRRDGAVIRDDQLMREFKPKTKLFWWCRGF